MITSRISLQHAIHSPIYVTPKINWSHLPIHHCYTSIKFPMYASVTPYHKEDILDITLRLSTNTEAIPTSADGVYM